MQWEPMVTLLELLSEHPRFKSLVQVVSLVVLFAGLYRYLVKPTWSFHWKIYEAADKALKSYPIIMRMAADFQPNGGHSLRDVINRIEQRQGFMESRVLALLTTSPGPLFECNQNGEWFWVNRALCDMTGYLPEQINGYGWMNLICQDYQVDITAQWNLAITQRRDTILEFDMVTRAETVVPVKLETTALRDKDIVVGYIGRLSVNHASPPPAMIAKNE